MANTIYGFGALGILGGVLLLYQDPLSFVGYIVVFLGYLCLCGGVGLRDDKQRLEREEAREDLEETP